MHFFCWNIAETVHDLSPFSVVDVKCNKTNRVRDLSLLHVEDSIWADSNVRPLLFANQHSSFLFFRCVYTIYCVHRWGFSVSVDGGDNIIFLRNAEMEHLHVASTRSVAGLGGLSASDQEALNRAVDRIGVHIRLAAHVDRVRYARERIARQSVPVFISVEEIGEMSSMHPVEMLRVFYSLHDDMCEIMDRAESASFRRGMEFLVDKITKSSIVSGSISGYANYSLMDGETLLTTAPKKSISEYVSFQSSRETFLSVAKSVDRRRILEKEYLLSLHRQFMRCVYMRCIASLSFSCLGERAIMAVRDDYCSRLKFSDRSGYRWYAASEEEIDSFCSTAVDLPKTDADTAHPDGKVSLRGHGHLSLVVDNSACLSDDAPRDAINIEDEALRRSVDLGVISSRRAKYLESIADDAFDFIFMNNEMGFQSLDRYMQEVSVLPHMMFMRDPIVNRKHLDVSLDYDALRKAPENHFIEVKDAIVALSSIEETLDCLGGAQEVELLRRRFYAIYRLQMDAAFAIKGYLHKKYSMMTQAQRLLVEKGALKNRIDYLGFRLNNDDSLTDVERVEMLDKISEMSSRLSSISLILSESE